MLRVMRNALRGSCKLLAVSQNFKRFIQLKPFSNPLQPSLHTSLPFVFLSGQKVTEQLYPSPKIGAGEYYIFIEEKAEAKRKAARQKKRCHMRFKGIKAEIKHPPCEQMLIAQIIQ